MVTPFYLEEHSSPDKGQYVWGYRITIENGSPETVTLISRYWRITDGNGMTQEVSGDGVVGQQPVLRPGESFEYTSGAPLETPGGFMGGSYVMAGATGRRFTVDIPAFALDLPDRPAAIH